MSISFTQRIEILQQLVRNLRAASRMSNDRNFAQRAAVALEDHLRDFERVDGLLRGLGAAMHEQTGVLPIADIEKRRAAVAMHVLDFFAAAINVGRDPRSVAKVLDTDQIDAIIAAALGVPAPLAAYREYKRERSTRAPDEPTAEEQRRARAVAIFTNACGECRGRKRVERIDYGSVSDADDLADQFLKAGLGDAVKVLPALKTVEIECPRCRGTGRAS